MPGCRSFTVSLLLILLATSATPAVAAAASCPVAYEILLKALQASVKPSGGPSNGGLDNNEWAAVVAQDGAICAIAYSGHAIGDQWLAAQLPPKKPSRLLG
jgi:hypothetical protein